MRPAGSVIAALLLAGSLALPLSAQAEGDRPAPPPAADEPGKGHLVWNDEFDGEGLPDPAVWGYDIGGSGFGNHELQFYSDARKDNARVSGGFLSIRAVKEKYRGRQYSSARLTTQFKKEFQYGRLEIRAKLPRGRGTWPALWLLPANGRYGTWPASGEIDIMEHVGMRPGVVQSSLHTDAYNFQKKNHRTATMDVPDAMEAFHVYALEWRPDSISISVDGKECLQAAFNRATEDRMAWSAWPFDRPFYLIMNLAIGGDWAGQQGIDDSLFPQAMVVDYVRLWDLGLAQPAVAGAPQAPAALDLVKNAGGDQVLSWPAARDEYAIDHYVIMRNGQEWISSYRNQVVIPRTLAPGRYVFTVRAFNTAGLWSESAASQQLVVSDTE